MTDLRPQFLSFDTIEFHARQVLEQYQPDALTRPEPVDAIGLLLSYLPRIGVQFSVGTQEELGTCEGVTEFYENRILVLLREDHWDALHRGGEPSLRARATVAHELGHVILHADYARRRAEYTHMLSELGDDIDCEGHFAQGIEDQEWQAWAFAGCLMMPVAMVQDMADLRPHAVGRVFDVSPQFARRHMFRMKREGLFC